MERLPIVRASLLSNEGALSGGPAREYGYAPSGEAPPQDGLSLHRPDFNKTTRLVHGLGQRYYAAYSNTVIACFPEKLRAALNTIAEHYGKDVEVTSGHRTNGRRGSYHRKCMAADIRVAGVTPAQLATFAKSLEGLNGVGSYHHNDVVHVDVRDYEMSWRY